LPETFSKKLELAFTKYGQVCVGIDPHAELLEENGFAQSAQGLREFSFALLEELSGQVGIIKPQISFFERFGSAGFAVLEELCSEATARGLLVIADAKRGDIGTTMAAYASAWLDKSAPFMVDALTVSPYLGVGSLAPAVSIAAERGKGLFVLCATSNSEGKTLQSARIGDATVAADVASEVATLNGISAQSRSRFGNVGLVIGATVDVEEFGIASVNSNLESGFSPILAPGFGAQGASLKDAKKLFGENAQNVIYTISRSALRDGLASVSDVVSRDAKELAEALSE